MYLILRAGEDAWRRAELEEAEAGQLGAAAAMGQVGAWLARYAEFACAAWDIHMQGAGTFARDVEHLAFLEHEFGYPPARHELPQRERSDSN